MTPEDTTSIYLVKFVHAHVASSFRFYVKCTDFVNVNNELVQCKCGHLEEFVCFSSFFVNGNSPYNEVALVMKITFK